MAQQKDRLLSEDLFLKGLARFLPQPNAPFLEMHSLRDGMFLGISELLMEYGKCEWAFRPRTFALLWMLNIPDRMDEFIADGRTDFSIPYKDVNLPDIIKGVEMRKKFIKLQDVVRCRSDQGIKRLEEGGGHVNLPQRASLYFKSIRHLGQGSFGEVDEVRSLQTTKRYARKQIHRGTTVFDDNAQLASFEKELKALKAISHRHIVKLVGSYTDDSVALGLILRPVADMNMQEYLDLLPRPGKHLRNFFGCLATALAYIHERNIRHKDIKPSNILIKDDQVMLADFGTSRVYLDGHLTSGGQTTQGTPRYRAPEVAENANRNSASDIWSLGCVFLEMATVLTGRTQNEMRHFYHQHGTNHFSLIHSNDIATRLWISELRGTGLDMDSNVLDWIEQMLQTDPNDRLTAAQVRQKILETESEVRYICLHCASRNGLEDSICIGSEWELGEPSVGTDRQSSNINPARAETDTTDHAHENNRGTDTASTPDSKVIPEIDDVVTEPQESTSAKSSIPTHTEDTTIISQKAPIEGIGGEYEDRNYQESDCEPTGDRCSIRDTAEPEHNSIQELVEYRQPDRRLRSKELTIVQDDSFDEPERIRFPSFNHRQLPTSSYVPSYVYASTNKLSTREVEVIEYDPANIFVYGRLMFPSVLHKIARHSLRAAYSPNRQIRLTPTSEDWAGADRSIQNASNLMTPALIRGYYRRTLVNSDCAVIQKNDGGDQGDFSSENSSKGVAGFLISGLSKQAMEYLDLLFESTERNLFEMKPTETSQDEIASPLHRRRVDVDVKLKRGELATIRVYTYAWRWAYFKMDDSTHWDPDQFIYSPVFQSTLRDVPSTYQQEQKIAARLGISYRLVGSIICKIVMKDKIQRLVRLLRRNWDPNSFCQIYGSPMHVAAALDFTHIVEMLINRGANVHADMGPHGTPLIISAKASRTKIVRLLLDRGANVLDTHPKEVNALYQAIAHSNHEMAELLLESGAWLLDGWYEMRDFAKERGDRAMISLLRRYDVRAQHDWFWSCMNKSEEPLTLKTNRLQLKATLIAKSFMSWGNWKGKSGVDMVVKALNAGASISILDALREEFGSFMQFRNRLTCALKVEEKR